MKLILLSAIMGIILFFPLNLEESTCLFAYLTALCAPAGNEPSSAMLDSYMRTFAIPWWSSVALAAWTISKQKKAKNKMNGEDHIND